MRKIKKDMQVLTDPEKIKFIANEKQGENEVFRGFLKWRNGQQIDEVVYKLNREIAPHVDCTRCGNCCRSLISATNPEIAALADHLQISPADFKEKYIEESEQGLMMIGSIPCHFLQGTSCSVYEHRFTQCREFPHLDKPHFTSRLFSTLMYYAVCPIIFNVIEKLKEMLGFPDMLNPEYSHIESTKSSVNPQPV